MKLGLFFCLSAIFSVSINATPWEQVPGPTNNISLSIGSYANGCLDGAQPLPLDGVGYQVLRSKTKRYYGHPHSILFIEKLSQKYNKSSTLHCLLVTCLLRVVGDFPLGTLAIKRD